MVRDIRMFRGRFTLREALLLGFCATFIVLTRAPLRIHFSLPGHSMFFLMFFLLVARGCVPRLGAATLVAALSGTVCALLGMTKLGPLVAVNFVMPAIFVDIACALSPRLVTRLWACILLAVLASASKALAGAAIDLLLEVDKQFVLYHVLVATGASMGFGALGASMVPPLIRRLQANRLVPTPGKASDPSTPAARVD